MIGIRCLVVFYFSILCFSTACTAQSKAIRADSIASRQPDQSSLDYSPEIDKLQQQVIELNKTVADNKKDYYDSQVNFLNYVLAAVGLLIILLGIWGYRSIAEKIRDAKDDTSGAIDKVEKNAIEVKNDIHRRLDDVKVDLREFKGEQRAEIERFKTEASERISQGLSAGLQNAIEKIMTGSFEGELRNLQDQFSDLKGRMDESVFKNQPSDTSAPGSDNAFENGSDESEDKANSNAFDDEHK